jgi:hypothetical protein
MLGVSAIAALVSAPFEIAANAKGGAEMHSFHFGKHFRPARHNRNINNRWPSWGYDGLDDLSYNDNAQPTVMFVSQPPAALNCQHSKEIKTVMQRAAELATLRSHVANHQNSTTQDKNECCIRVCRERKNVRKEPKQETID